MSYTIYPDELICYQSGDGLLFTPTGKKTVWRKGRSIGFSWRSCFWSFELLYADSFPRQLSGEYITGICGNQHNHGEVWMWTADTREALRWNRRSVHSRIPHGRYAGNPETIPGICRDKRRVAGGNCLLPCVCCCSSAIPGMEQKKAGSAAG